MRAAIQRVSDNHTNSSMSIFENILRYFSPFHYLDSKDSDDNKSETFTSGPSTVYKEIFCFSINQPMQANVHNDSQTAIPNGFQLMFACHSMEDALSWVSCVNSVSGNSEITKGLKSILHLSETDSYYRAYKIIRLG